jgi:hypothetical protein
MVCFVGPIDPTPMPGKLCLVVAFGLVVRVLVLNWLWVTLLSIFIRRRPLGVAILVRGRLRSGRYDIQRTLYVKTPVFYLPLRFTRIVLDIAHT